ncbi:hypothetical protein EW146_g2163 [Bondarzewia mesenterica]|uniref:Ubiquitin-related modifier 1 n=1 Tax=Bondarzewia mesenterica TaxID=1095465 RepID=A0A4S4M1F4_9AGAM|nr:hypothetical protein EW146_g2163 [Bondarzewia mesenterica]
MSTINLKIEFGGGLELLFSNQRSHRVSIPARAPTASPLANGSEASKTKPADIDFLVGWLKDNLLRERAELFVENGTVRPGILVLVNDADWELEGEGEYELKEGDEIVFISTLHGG